MKRNSIINPLAGLAVFLAIAHPSVVLANNPLTGEEILRIIQEVTEELKINFDPSFTGRGQLQTRMQVRCGGAPAPFSGVDVLRRRLRRRNTESQENIDRDTSTFTLPSPVKTSNLLERSRKPNLQGENLSDNLEITAQRDILLACLGAFIAQQKWNNPFYRAMQGRERNYLQQETYDRRFRQLRERLSSEENLDRRRHLQLLLESEEISYRNWRESIRDRYILPEGITSVETALEGSEGRGSTAINYFLFEESSIIERELIQDAYYRTMQDRSFDRLLQESRDRRLQKLKERLRSAEHPSLRKYLELLLKSEELSEQNWQEFIQEFRTLRELQFWIDEGLDAKFGQIATSFERARFLRENPNFRHREALLNSRMSHDFRMRKSVEEGRTMRGLKFGSEARFEAREREIQAAIAPLAMERDLMKDAHYRAIQDKHFDSLLQHGHKLYLRELQEKLRSQENLYIRKYLALLLESEKISYRDRREFIQEFRRLRELKFWIEAGLEGLEPAF